MRKPNPELPRDLDEFRRVTANAQDDLSALVDPDMLTDKRACELVEVWRVGADRFADYDIDPGNTGATSSTMLKTTAGAAD